MVDQEVAIQALVVVGVLMAAYVALIRPQLKRIAENDRLLSSLNVGDRVITGGGLIGKIARFEGPRIVEIELSNAMRVQALRSSIESRLEG
jgi:preprotein translocase subunit YajC